MFASRSVPLYKTKQNGGACTKQNKMVVPVQNKTKWWCLYKPKQNGGVCTNQNKMVVPVQMYDVICVTQVKS